MPHKIFVLKIEDMSLLERPIYKQVKKKGNYTMKAYGGVDV
jgi:hypothetical protein